MSGKAVYTRDIYLPGMLYAKILSSPYAHAKIKSIDTSTAEALPGVRDILKYNDSDIESDTGTGAWYEVSGMYNVLTLSGTSEYFQHPMGVAVVADSEEICDRALRLMKIEWEELPFILDMEESVKPTAIKTMPEVKRIKEKAREPNTVIADDVTYGNLEKGFAEADKIIEYKIRRETNSAAGVEAAAVVAQWRGDFLDLWVHHQDIPQWFLINPQDTRGKHIPPLAEWSKITVTMPYQGALFGGFSWLVYSQSFTRLAVILARRADGRPVKLFFDDSNLCTLGDDAGTYTCKVGAKKDGTITAMHWHMVGVRNSAIEKTYECTKIPNIRGSQEWPLVNQGHMICFRHGAHCLRPAQRHDRSRRRASLDWIRPKSL